MLDFVVGLHEFLALMHLYVLNKWYSSFQLKEPHLARYFFWLQINGKHARYGWWNMLSCKGMLVSCWSLFHFSVRHLFWCLLMFHSIWPDLTLHKLFYTRAELYRTVYVHAKVKVWSIDAFFPLLHLFSNLDVALMKTDDDIKSVKICHDILLLKFKT